jgi:hypothetical protein
MRLIALVSAALLALTVSGCGSGKLKTRGRVLKDGAPLVCGQGEIVRVVFVPVLEPGQRLEDVFVAEYNRQDGTFQVAGKDLQGMPPGKYRVCIAFEKKHRDVFKGKYGAERTPYVFDVDSSTKELVIDLDRAPSAQG